MANFDNIYVLGSHDLSVSYSKRLQKSKESGGIQFKKLSFINDCSEFILDYIDRVQEKNSNDTLIPDHTAKHVFLKVFLDLIQKKFPSLKATLCPIEFDVKTPFLHKMENDSIWAMSYATWTCPENCNEPDICPHTNAQRDWDFEKEFGKSENKMFYTFPCSPLIEEVSHIPIKKIMKEMNDFSFQLKNNFRGKVVVATHSRCHAIMGQFEI